MTHTSTLPASFTRRHLLTCEGLKASEITALLDIADKAAEQNKQVIKKRDVLRGRTLINLFFEPSTRTQSSFELAAKRLGADVMNMNVATSSVSKGETLIDTAMTLNAMRPWSCCNKRSTAPSSMLATARISTRRKPCSMR
jgi:aspartate carbamoyltransferase catalytic subunit